MRTNVMVRDLDMGIPLVGDARKLEVVVCGLPLFSGRQLAVDATPVGALHADGSARARAANEDGAALVAARRRKEQHLAGVGAPSRARLVVLAGEIGGQWSVETTAFVSVASSLLELRRPHGADGEGAQSHEVNAEFRYAGLA